LKRKRHRHPRTARRDGAGGAPGTGGDSRTAPVIGDETWHIGAVLVAVAVAAVIVRTVFLAADPPVDLSWSQALFTDGARAIDGARNKIMYGDWMADRISPVLLFYPISNLLAYFIYRISGIGLVQANLTGVIPALAALALVYLYMRRWGGTAVSAVALALFALPYVLVIYTRTPLVESLQIFLLLAAFVTFLRGGSRGSLAAGALTGAAALMVKLHALHFAAAAGLFLLLASRLDAGSRVEWRRRAVFFFGGLGIAVAVWAAVVYSVDPGAVSKYFKSNILISQRGEYQGASLAQIVAARLKAFFHAGSGMDGFFSKAPVLSVFAAGGLLSALSRFNARDLSRRPWELLSAVWFVVLCSALSLLSYRPLRYFVPLVPSMCFLATSFLVRLMRGEPILNPEKPRWFKAAFLVWFVWVFIHLQHDIIFRAVRPGVRGYVTSAQQSLLRYDMAILPQILLTGGIGFALILFLGKSLGNATWSFAPRVRRDMLIVALGSFLVLNIARFADYCVNRKYSLVEMAESLERITSPGVFLVGDCATTLSLETDFRTLPSYGELIRRDDLEQLTSYPITHFLIRFPRLHEYLTENFPDFATRCIPVARYYLCGREATVVRYEQWPGYPSTYSPSDFEEGMMLLSRGHVNNALSRFQSFLEEHPDSYEAMFGEAICLSVSGDIGGARAALDQAIEIAPPDALPYHVYRDILGALKREDATRR
jgi:hypothetical protein